ncbi:MAG: hypothetical protein A2Y17_08065 [Clostridiales bacterium GWF2_38_85]|nr:MAG: hypothetical protein A2Y17_08065 [Clostridiales bacterium GWF2_38_85]HBL83853.1 hypothetical protein [Clostridiales bacterium]
MSISVTTTNITKAFKATAANFATATNATAGAADTFVFELERADTAAYVLISNPLMMGGTNVTIKFAKGNFWAGKVIDTTELTIAAGDTAIIAIESSFVKKADGTMSMTVTPVTTSIALASIGLTVSIIERSITSNN